jgi:hypothetical protein
MLSVTFTRAALSLPDLVVGDHPGNGSLYVTEDGVGAVGWDFRRTYAPDSGWMSGKGLLAAVREASTLPLTIYAHAATSAALGSTKAELEAVAAQWSYTATVTVDGVSEVYNCEPAIPQWGSLDSGMIRAHLARCQLVIPVNP